MDELEIRSGVIPLRHSSLPGHIKLPRRYEKAATGSNGIPARARKISIQPGQSAWGDSLSERLDDLMAAFMWVKQELIMLRQHDILLKRQFFNIQVLIHSLRPKPATPSFSTSTSTTSTTTTSTTTTSSEVTFKGSEGKSEVTKTIESVSTTLLSTSTSTSNNNSSSNNSCSSNNNSSSNNSCSSSGYGSDFSMTAFFVRQALSVSVLHEESEEDEGEGDLGNCREGVEDMLIGDVGFFRLRSSSMRTTRDMAALARRRGSKDLI